MIFARIVETNCMNQKKFNNLPTLDKEAVNELANNLEQSVSFICISTKKSQTGDVRFGISYEGDKTLLLNSAMALFRAKDDISGIMRQAFMHVLHEETVAGYSGDKGISNPYVG